MLYRSSKSFKEFIQEGSIPPILYKYRCWSNIEHRSILTDFEVYFCKFSEWGYELKIPFNFDYILKNIDLYANKFVEFEHPDFTQEQKQKRIEHIIATTPMKNPYLHNKMENKFKEGLNNRVGILCMTSKCDNLQLWRGSFGDKNKGFCVGFDSALMFSDSEEFNGGGYVNYFSKDDYPLITPISLNEEDMYRNYSTIIYSLPDKFKNQEEYRIIKTADSKDFLTVSDRKVKVKPEAYKEIVFGHSMPEHHKNAIKKIVKSKGINVKFFQSKVRGKDVKLEEIPF